MLWVCRAGRNSLYYDYFVEKNSLFIPWDRFKFDFSELHTLIDFKLLVSKELDTTNRSTVANIASQLNSFCNVMEKGDFVLLPGKHSRQYLLCKINGNYQYNVNEKLPHSRSVQIIYKDIPRNIFSKSIQYSLGTYRTIFKVRQEEEVLSKINEFIKVQSGRDK